MGKTKTVHTLLSDVDHKMQFVNIIAIINGITPKIKRNNYLSEVTLDVIDNTKQNPGFEVVLNLEYELLDQFLKVAKRGLIIEFLEIKLIKNEGKVFANVLDEEEIRLYNEKGASLKWHSEEGPCIITDTVESTICNLLQWKKSNFKVSQGALLENSNTKTSRISALQLNKSSRFSTDCSSIINKSQTSKSPIVNIKTIERKSPDNKIPNKTRSTSPSKKKSPSHENIPRTRSNSPIVMNSTAKSKQNKNNKDTSLTLTNNSPNSVKNNDNIIVDVLRKSRTKSDITEASNKGDVVKTRPSVGKDKQELNMVIDDLQNGGSVKRKSDSMRQAMNIKQKREHSFLEDSLLKKDRNVNEVISCTKGMNKEIDTSDSKHKNKTKSNLPVNRLQYTKSEGLNEIQSCSSLSPRNLSKFTKSKSLIKTRSSSSLVSANVSKLTKKSRSSSSLVSGKVCKLTNSEGMEKKRSTSSLGTANVCKLKNSGRLKRTRSSSSVIPANVSRLINCGNLKKTCSSSSLRTANVSKLTTSENLKKVHSSSPLLPANVSKLKHSESLKKSRSSSSLLRANVSNLKSKILKKSCSSSSLLQRNISRIKKSKRLIKVHSSCPLSPTNPSKLTKSKRLEKSFSSSSSLSDKESKLTKSKYLKKNLSSGSLVPANVSKLTNSKSLKKTRSSSSFIPANLSDLREAKSLRKTRSVTSLIPENKSCHTRSVNPNKTCKRSSFINKSKTITKKGNRVTPLQIAKTKHNHDSSGVRESFRYKTKNSPQLSPPSKRKMDFCLNKKNCLKFTLTSSDSSCSSSNFSGSKLNKRKTLLNSSESSVSSCEESWEESHRTVLSQRITSENTTNKKDESKIKNSSSTLKKKKSNETIICTNMEIAKETISMPKQNQVDISSNLKKTKNYNRESDDSQLIENETKINVPGLKRKKCAEATFSESIEILMEIAPKNKKVEKSSSLSKIQTNSCSRNNVIKKDEIQKKIQSDSIELNSKGITNKDNRTDILKVTNKSKNLKNSNPEENPKERIHYIKEKNIHANYLNNANRQPEDEIETQTIPPIDLNDTHIISRANNESVMDNTIKINKESKIQNKLIQGLKQSISEKLLLPDNFNLLQECGKKKQTRKTICKPNEKPGHSKEICDEKDPIFNYLRFLTRKVHLIAVKSIAEMSLCELEDIDVPEKFDMECKVISQFSLYEDGIQIVRVQDGSLCKTGTLVIPKCSSWKEVTETIIKNPIVRKDSPFIDIIIFDFTRMENAVVPNKFYKIHNIMAVALNLKGDPRQNDKDKGELFFCAEGQNTYTKSCIGKKSQLEIKEKLEEDSYKSAWEKIVEDGVLEEGGQFDNNKNGLSVTLNTTNIDEMLDSSSNTKSANKISPNRRRKLDDSQLDDTRNPKNQKKSILESERDKRSDVMDSERNQGPEGSKIKCDNKSAKIHSSINVLDLTDETMLGETPNLVRELSEIMHEESIVGLPMTLTEDIHLKNSGSEVTFTQFCAGADKKSLNFRTSTQDDCPFEYFHSLHEKEGTQSEDGSKMDPLVYCPSGSSLSSAAGVSPLKQHKSPENSICEEHCSESVLQNCNMGITTESNPNKSPIKPVVGEKQKGVESKDSDSVISCSSPVTVISSNSSEFEIQFVDCNKPNIKVSSRCGVVKRKRKFNEIETINLVSEKPHVSEFGNSPKKSMYTLPHSPQKIMSSEDCNILSRQDEINDQPHESLQRVGITTGKNYNKTCKENKTHVANSDSSSNGSCFSVESNHLTLKPDHPVQTSAVQDTNSQAEEKIKLIPEKYFFKAAHKPQAFTENDLNADYSDERGPIKYLSYSHDRSLPFVTFHVINMLKENNFITTNVTLVSITPSLTDSWQEHCFKSKCPNCNRMFDVYNAARNKNSATNADSTSAISVGSHIVCPDSQCCNQVLDKPEFHFTVELKLKDGTPLTAFISDKHAEDVFGCTAENALRDEKHLDLVGDVLQKITNIISDVQIAKVNVTRKDINNPDSGPLYIKKIFF